MATSIGVRESTRNALERLKRDLGLASLDATLMSLLDERKKAPSATASTALLALIAHRPALARFAKRRGIRSLRVFGSVLHGEAGRGSDLDLLVEFEPGRMPGLITFGGIERELTNLLGVKVDLQTSASLSKHFRDQVRAEAIEIHAPS
jgi:predicted nucleotidyltransferase